ncbi:MAG: NUDIX domain-containing protein [Firmicutes bacterium]|nr:NUDIX domain-containing protein [Bacillota bacterium]
MRLLFELDKKDYDKCTRSYVRNSARSVIIRDGRVAMVHSLKYDYYKFPGGGIEAGESIEDAVIRETLEESGLRIIRSSMREFGYVHRIQRNTYDSDECFIQDNYYYLCKAEDGLAPQELDDYEARERFTLEFVTPEKAMAVNRAKGHGPKDPVMLEREARVLEMLKNEGFFS